MYICIYNVYIYVTPPDVHIKDRSQVSIVNPKSRVGEFSRGNNLWQIHNMYVWGHQKLRIWWPLPLMKLSSSFLLYFAYDLFKIIVLILVGNTEHVTHKWRRIGLFWEKIDSWLLQILSDALNRSNNRDHSLLVASEITANLYCNCVHLYWESCVICGNLWNAL